MNNVKIRWGIIGLGKIARKFAEDLSLMPDGELYAVASHSAERSTAFASQYGAKMSFDSYEALCQCPEVDIVYIATPHTGHHASTLMCLELGKPVLCEKPFAMNASQAAEMIALARSKQLFLMDALWTLFIPAVRQALDWTRQGKIGDLLLVQSAFGYKSTYDPDSRIFNPALGGGSLLDIGIYPVLLALATLGKPDESAVVAQATFTRDQVDESCFFNFRYGDRKMASGYSSIAATLPVEAMIYGTEGYLKLHQRWHHAHGLSVYRYGETEQHFDLPFQGWGYHFEIAHVHACLQQGLTESPIATHQLSLDLLTTLDNIRACIGLEYAFL